MLGVARSRRACIVTVIVVAFWCFGTAVTRRITSARITDTILLLLLEKKVVETASIPNAVQAL